MATTNMPGKGIKVAVVGCGAAGLCVLRHLTTPKNDLSDLIDFEAVCFEQAPQIGGTWVYSPSTGYDAYGLPVHTSIYKNLRTNLPKDVMCFPDFPYHPDLPSFLHHSDVRAYLEDYAQHFHLLKHIKLQTKVELVEPVPGTDGSQNSVKWKVTYQKVSDNSKEDNNMISDVFDALIICNGHYSVPYIPEIKGKEIFKGIIIHSHDYREPEMFVDKTVVCLGAKSSGIDISIELTAHTNKVFLSHRRQPLQAEFPENLFQKPGIHELTSDGVVFENGEFHHIDALILCTGYKISFPFLHENCGVQTKHNRVTPFYKHLINIDFPNMAIIGLCMNITPLPLFHIQASFVKAVLLGKIALPTADEMRKDEQEDFDQRLRDGMAKHHAHVLGEKQWNYNNEMATVCGCELLPKHFEDIYKFVHIKRSRFPAKYKEMDIDVAYKNML